MEVAVYPSEFVPMKDNKYDAEKPDDPEEVQYTTVEVSCSPPVPPPRDHIVWSMCCLLYANPLCLGMAALYFSFKARDRKVAGDLEGAKKHGCIACGLNISALVLVVIMIIVVFFCYATIMMHINEMLEKIRG